MRVLLREGGIQDGGRLIFKIKQGLIPVKWEALHHGYILGKQFCDRQMRGPFSAWNHVHRFLEAPNDQSLLCDQVDWSLPPRGLLDVVAMRPMEKMLDNMFRLRHRRTHDDLQRHQQHPERFSVLLAGRSTPLMQALSAFLSTGGHKVYLLEPRSGRYIMRDWLGDQPQHILDELDAVIHSGLPYDERNTDLSYLDFLHTAFKTLGHKPDLWLNLRVKRPVMDRFTSDPSIEFGNQHKPGTDLADHMEPALEKLAPYFDRTLDLFPGSLIRAPFGYLATLLMRLETYLFLKGSAQTFAFHWLSMDDAVGAIWFVLCNRKLSGAFTVSNKQPGTRAELQECLIKQNFMAYTGHRILKVLPWSAPGRPAGMDPEFQELPSLLDHAFSPLAGSLTDAVRRELGY